MFNIMFLMFVSAGSTIGLLGVGFWVGKSFGKGDGFASGSRAMGDSEWVHVRRLQELDTCAATSQIISEQSRQLQSLAVSQMPGVGADLIESIEQLVQTTQSLALRLTAARELAPPAAEDSCHPPPQVSTSSARHHLEAYQASGLAGSSGGTFHSQRACLSAEEMQTVMPGPGHVGAESQRRKYVCDQRMAPYMLDEAMPKAAEFRPVKCHDISMEGISFVTPETPDYDRVVISMGPPESLLYMAATVIHSRAVFMYGNVGYLVSCSFIKRMEQPPEEGAA